MPITDITTGLTFGTLSDAIIAANPGDTIQLSAGTYSEDFPKINKDLTIQGVGGLARLTPLPTVSPQPGDPIYQMPSNGQGILVTRGAVTLDHLELTGAVVPDGNGAGVRYETGSLTISNSWLHGNQNGLLGNPNPGAAIAITRSEFDHNGSGDGLTHNLYVGQIGTLTIDGSYFHDANVGHEIKSRADTTIITNTRIQDGPIAPTSYSVDLPNGGIAVLAHDIIEKGANAQNFALIHFGGEAFPVIDPSSLTIDDLTAINNLDPLVTLGWSPLVLDHTEPYLTPLITNSAFYGLSSDQLLTNAAGGLVSGVAYTPPPLNNHFFSVGAAPPLDLSHPFEVPEPMALPMMAVLVAALVIRGSRRWVM